MERSAIWRCAAASLLVLVPRVCAAAVPSDVRAATQPPPDLREQTALAAELADCPASVVADDQYEATVHARAARLRAALERLNAVRDASADAAERARLRGLRLQTLFDIAALEGGPFEPLRREAEEARRAVRDGPAPEDADYWSMRLDLLALDRPAADPTAVAARVRRIEAFLDRHPDARMRDPLVGELLDAAGAANDFVAVERRLPPSAGSDRQAAGAWRATAQHRLRRAVGEVWAPSLSDAGGAPLDWQALRGRPSIVLFWASWDAVSLALLDAMRSWPGVRDPHRLGLVTYALDRNAGSAAAALDSRGLRSIRCGGGRGGPGWSDGFVQNWGVRALPTVLVLDAEGRLRAVLDPTNDDLPSAVRTAWAEAGGRS